MKKISLRQLCEEKSKLCHRCSTLELSSHYVKISAKGSALTCTTQNSIGITKVLKFHDFFNFLMTTTYNKIFI